MSHPDAERTSSPSHAPSDEAWLSIYLFPCGHGDTILIRLPGKRWALVDCHLPVVDGTRGDFFDFVKKNDISRLEWIVQTHPDYDHFHGMTSVLNYFTTPPRSVGYWCDGGLNVQQIRDLISWSSTSSREYRVLHQKLDELDGRDAIKFVELSERAETMSPKGYEGRIDFLPVGPSATLKRRTSRKGLQNLAANPNAKLEANDLSVVLVLSIRHNEHPVHILLPGDAGRESLAAALEVWTHRAGKVPGSESFEVVKVPHHGSIRSHAPAACKARAVGSPNCVAAISAGTRAALPDREVLRAFISEGWKVLVTTVRGAASSASRPFGVINRGTWPRTSAARRLIEISWAPRRGIEWAPPDAAVGEAALGHYQTASG